MLLNHVCQAAHLQEGILLVSRYTILEKKQQIIRDSHLEIQPVFAQKASSRTKSRKNQIWEEPNLWTYLCGSLTF